MSAYVVNDGLSRLIYKGLKLSKMVICTKSRDRFLQFCRHIDSRDGVKVELIDKWNIRIIIDPRYVIIGESSYYKIVGGAGKTLFYALKTLTNIPAPKHPGLGFTRNVEVIDYGDMIIVVLEDVVAVVGKDNYVSISNLFMSYEEELFPKNRTRNTENKIQQV